MSTSSPGTPEHSRLLDPAWKRWGPYLAERAWGTVREDYSADGDAWNAFSHDQARYRAYRWNEDGLGGFCDDGQRLCLAVGLWNGADPILKERLFGLTNDEGNHGEDVKEAYYYTDATPTASYAEMRYLYPREAFPYTDLIAENSRRGRGEPEYEIEDTGVFASGCFDVAIRYAKAGPDEIVLQIEATNHSLVAADLVVIPTLWFRNTWSWGYDAGPQGDSPARPILKAVDGRVLAADQGRDMSWSAPDADELVFCDNETNHFFPDSPEAGFPKDAFNRYVVDGDESAVNPARRGTKVGAIHRMHLEAGRSRTVEVMLQPTDAVPIADPGQIVADRRQEADTFFSTMPELPDHLAAVRRQAFAGLIWTKQFYYYNVGQWLTGDPAYPRPQNAIAPARNVEWDHIDNHDILSMPDAWEYPWYATWDLAFHAVPFAEVDATFAKANLEVVTTNRFLHPNGQLPAYEWDFGNVNPPVMAWAARKVHEADVRHGAEPDNDWLANVFYLLSLNYTWWQNREDDDGNNVFAGGFLGLDNISLFDRSSVIPTGGHIDQSDGTAWMAFFSLGMLRIALTLAQRESRFEAIAMRFFRQFGEITVALLNSDHCLWDPADNFFYDVLHLPDGSFHQLRIKSLVGLLPVIAVEVVPEAEIEALPAFAELLAAYESKHPSNAPVCTQARAGRRLLSVLDEAQLRAVLAVMLDPAEFLSPFGIRSMSKAHSEPYVLHVDGVELSIAYEPGESNSPLFGGNSNWRGPIWFPLNYLLIEALREYHTFFGDSFVVEYPTGSGQSASLEEVADDLADRLVSLFVNAEGRSPSQGPPPVDTEDHLVLFHEYFDAETGRGLGASHQTGWTALVAMLLNSTRSK